MTVLPEEGIMPLDAREAGRIQRDRSDSGRSGGRAGRRFGTGWSGDLDRLLDHREADRRVPYLNDIPVLELGLVVYPAAVEGRAILAGQVADHPGVGTVEPDLGM